MLAPHSTEELALPPDDLLIGDLTSPHYRIMSGGKIQVESKDDIKKRIGRSTDTGDATCQAFWPNSSGWTKAYGIVHCDHCNQPFMSETNPDRCPHCRQLRPLDEDTEVT
jgi:hypothetical protein